MSPAALALGCIIALLAAAVLNTAIRAWADVRIAAHTGVDPRVDREAAKQARAGTTGRIGGGEIVDRIELNGQLDRGGSKD